MKLADACRRAGPGAGVTVMASVAQALAHTEGEPLTVVAGSLYLVGEALESLCPAARPPQNERGLNEWAGAPKV
jgi:folylpolyglutamate synthase/dihydropteroate synthase